jgi:methanogenic corrinoid protein MtbC1
MTKRATFKITAVERDVGLSKDVLRVWERRYGFPAPGRDARGERVYPAEQVERLRLIKRLLDRGHRPGRLLAASAGELRALSSAARAARPEPGQGLDELIDSVKRHDSDGYANAVLQRLARQGLQRFVQDTLAPLTREIGLAWEEGRVQVFEEHLFTELTARVLRQAIESVPPGGRPRIVLTSVPNEQHGLGLLMAEAVLCLEGARCIPLGTQTPTPEIVRAAAAYAADVVALSFSTAFPRRQVSALLRQLREMLPRQTELWAGGGGMQGIAAPDGVSIVLALEDAAAAVGRFKDR